MLPLSLTRYRAGLLGLMLIVLILSCIDPPWPNHLILQHIPTAIGIGLLLWAGHKLELSDASFTCIIIFMLLHILGARWIYSYVPYDDWSAWLTGHRISDVFGFERNHYDRLVHFSYGLLFSRPIRELLVRFADMRPRLARWLGVEFVLGTSALYELVEWLIAIVLSPETADAYNGQQGDMWDAQKDMALALGGAMIGTMLARYDRRHRPND